MIAPPRARSLAEGDAGGLLAVFVHGLEDDWRSWVPVARELGAGWDAVALDLPWRAGNDYRWRWEDSAVAFVAAGVNAMSREPDVVVGHSFGANAALEAVARGHTRSRALVLAMPFYRPPDPRPSWTTWDKSRTAFEFQMREAVRTRLDGRIGDLGDELVERMVAKVFERIGLPGFLSVFDQYVSSGHLPVADVDVPVLIVAGERDPGFSPSQLSHLVEGLPDATLSVHPEFDHFCHVRRGPEFAALLVEFAAELGRARSATER